MINPCLLLQIVLVCSHQNLTPLNSPGYCGNAEGYRTCCSNYHYMEGQCVECPKGTFRFNDVYECVSCDVGYYGRFCAYECDCRKDQRCDAVEGCVCSIHLDSCKEEVLFPFIYWLMIMLPVIVIVVAIIIICTRTIKRRKENKTREETGEHVSDTSNHSYLDFNEFAVLRGDEPLEQPQLTFNTVSPHDSDNLSHNIYINVQIKGV